MTKRTRRLWVALVATAAIAAVSTTLAVPPWMDETDDVWGVSSTASTE